MQVTYAKNIMQKNMFSSFQPILTFFVFFTCNQNIDTQLCTHVKSHHHHMKYVILDHLILFT
jgi:hypothetical protein